MNSVIARAREYLLSASESEKTAVEYILENPSEASEISIHELSKRVFSSASTITRLCKKLGFSGYRDYQRALIEELSQRSVRITSDLEISKNSSIEEITEKTVARSVSSLEDTGRLLDPQSVGQCVNKIIHSDQLVFFGEGASLLVAQDAYLKFIRVRRNCLVAADADVQKVICRLLNSKDVAVLISYSGKTDSVVTAARLLKERKVPIIAITSNREGNVAKLADFNLFVSPTEYTYSAGKFTSRLSQLIVVDILYLTYLQWTYKTSYSTLAETQINHIKADIK